MSPSNHPDDQAEGPVRPVIRLAAAGLLATAGGLHLAALPGHLQASAVAGVFFAVTAAAQLLGAVLVATRPSLRTARAVVVGNVGVLILWAMSRTTGLPTGGELGVREPFGLLDGLAAAAEVLVVVAGLTTTVHQSRRPGRRSGGWRLALALALTWGFSGGAGFALADDGHHHGGAHSYRGPASGDHSHAQSDRSDPADFQPRSERFNHTQPAEGHTRSPAATHAGHGHETPAPSGLITGVPCPAGHDCEDHSH